MSFLETLFGKKPEQQKTKGGLTFVQEGVSYSDPESPQPGLCVVAVAIGGEGETVVKHVHPDEMQTAVSELKNVVGNGRAVLVNGTQRGEQVDELVRNLWEAGFGVQDQTGGEFDGRQRVTVTNTPDSVEIEIANHIDFEQLRRQGILPNLDRPVTHIRIQKESSR